MIPIAKPIIGDDEVEEVVKGLKVRIHSTGT